MVISKRLQVFTIALILLGCGGNNDTGEKEEEILEQSKYGGVFRMPIDSYFIVSQVNEIQKIEELQVYSQVYEGLVKYNPKTLNIEPALAEKWTISDDGMTYVFTLRENVYFHDNSCFEQGKGRKLTPEDVVYSFTQIYAPKPTNSAYSFFKNSIVGGDDYHEGKADEVSGISTNGNEITIELESPSLAFIQKLASIFGVILPKEAVESANYTPVGTGPFVFDSENSNSEIVRLARNNNYYGLDDKGDQLPYLDSVVFVLYENKNDQMDLFWNENLTYIPKVPITKISEVLEERIDEFESNPPKYILNSEPILVTTYLEFNMKTPVLRKKKVRQALSYAINRKKLVEKILKNQAYEIGKFGITPPLPKVYGDYDFEGVEDVSYVYNPQKAKELLAQAGYPEGRNFPSLEMQFKAGSTDYLIASEIQSQLRSVLNINIDIEAIEFNQLLENQAMGDADIFRTNWVGDFATPEAFLVNAYGKVVPKKSSEPSYLNSSRYQNKTFDRLFEEGMMAMDPVAANKSFGEAEKVLMEDSPFIILWYGEDLELKQANLQAFETNGISYIDLKNTYFREPVANQQQAVNQ